MSVKIELAITRAIQNYARFGDTDVFPYLFERHLFYDKAGDVEVILLDIHNNFDHWMSNVPPITHESLTQVGYTGFRWATQIEPFWNAYYLALVISLCDQIEQRRISQTDGTVFSYRYSWSEKEHKLFADSTWNDYRKRCVELSEECAFVVLTDVSDFYPRIYHHRLENELNRLPTAGDAPSRILKLLNSFAKNVSYGLPVGGPASRILAELALNSVDHHLARRNISFCRYADDYCMFCESKAEAYSRLVLLSEKLFNEGLVLQKNKTRIVSAAEFYESWRLLDPKTKPTTDEEKLLNISFRFDPYSETAAEDYEVLEKAVQEVDVLGILAREITKTAIDTSVTKQAINAIRAMDANARESAIRTLLAKENLDVLSPVFVTLMRAVRAVYDDIPDDAKDAVDEALVQIFEQNEHLLAVEVNLAFFLQALSMRHSQRKEEIFVKIYDSWTSPILRRIIIAAMCNWNCHYWLSDFKATYAGLNLWEKRAAIIGSYFLGDEGSHWRNNTKRSWGAPEVLIRDWFADRFQTQKNVPI